MSTRIPINRGKILDNDRSLTGMQSNMDNRRKEWEKEIEKMRSEFFTMSPSLSHTSRPTATSVSHPNFGASKLEDGKGRIERDAAGNPVYRAVFDLHEYEPDAVNVKTDESKFVVTAKQKKHEGSTTLTREYNKQMDLPPEIDPLSLTCSMSTEGLLVVEAKIPTPAYKNISSMSAAQPAAHPTSTSLFHIDSAKHQPKVENVHVKEKREVDSKTLSSEPILKSAMSTPSYAASPKTSELRKSPISVDKSRQTYTIEVDIEDFKPEELNVKTVDGKLIVTATREDKTGSRTSTKQMTREFTIPNDVEPTSVKAYFTESGKLLIEAPYRIQ